MGKGDASYIFGIMSIVFGFLSPLAGLIFGIMGMNFGKNQKAEMAKKGRTCWMTRKKMPRRLGQF